MCPKKDEPKYYNSGPSRSFIQLIEKRYPEVDINEILTYAGIEKHEIEDENFWFTQSQVNRFYEKAKELCKNEQLSREAGRYALETEGLGIFKHYFLKLGSIKKAYLLSATFSNRLDHATHYEANIIGKNKVEIIATPKPEVKQERFQCENRWGNIEQVPAVFGGTLENIEHEECIFNGAERCQYIVTWKETKMSRLKPYRNWFFLIIPLLYLIAVYFYTDIVFIGIPIVLMLIMGAGWGIERIEKNQLSDQLNTLQQLNSLYDEMMQQSEIKADVFEIVKQIGEEISKKAVIEDTLDNILKIILDHLGYDRGIFLLADDTGTRLRYQTSVGFTQDDLNILSSAEFNTANPQSLNYAFVEAFMKKKSVVIDNKPENDRLSSDEQIAEIFQSEAIICCPIIFEARALGIVAIFDDQKRKRRFQRPDKLLMGIAPAIGKALK